METGKEPAFPLLLRIPVFAGGPSLHAVWERAFKPGGQGRASGRACGTRKTGGKSSRS